MPLDDREGALTAERSTWDFDWTPLGSRFVVRPDVRAWCWYGAWAGSCGVGGATWRDEEVDRELPSVLGFFAGVRRPVRWYVGPTTTSRHIARVLERRAGAVHEPRLMTAELSESHARVNASVRVTEVAAGPLVREIIETAFPDWTAERRETAIAEKLAYLSGPRMGGELAAFIGEELVGNANWRDSTDGVTVDLVGAWTRPSYRGRGVYSTLCAYRRDRALERGRRYAAIVADPTTSGPIVGHAGFRDHGPLFIYSDIRP